MLEIKFQPSAVSAAQSQQEPLSEIKDNGFPFLDKVFFFSLFLSDFSVQNLLDLNRPFVEVLLTQLPSPRSVPSPLLPAHLSFHASTETCSEREVRACKSLGLLCACLLPSTPGSPEPSPSLQGSPVSGFGRMGRNNLTSCLFSFSTFRQHPHLQKSRSCPEEMGSGLQLESPSLVLAGVIAVYFYFTWIFLFPLQ